MGYTALLSNTTASQSIAIGSQAGKSQTTLGANTFVGNDAGRDVTGQQNAFYGHDSGRLVTSGQKNTIIGSYDGNQNGLDIRTSSNNIVLSDGDGTPRLRTDSFNRTKMGINLGTTSAGNNPVLGLERDFVNHNTVIETIADTVNARFHIAFVNANGNVGDITTSGSATSYNTSSDHRLKENVVELTGATERLKQLNPSRFNFIADADTTVDGFLAHEVQSVVPEAVHGTHNEVKTWTQEEIDTGDAPANTSAGDNKLDGDGNTIPVYQGIDQSKLVPLLVATIQELEARITALENA